MSRRRHAVLWAAIAFSAALVPSAAYAGSLPHAAAASHPGPSTAVSGVSAKAKTPPPKTSTAKSSSPYTHSKISAEPHSATGKTIYVAGTGSCTTDTGNGTSARPYCSLQNGVNAAAAGDTVAITGAYYDLPGPVTVSTSGISIIGVGAEPVAVNTAAGYDPALEYALNLTAVSNVEISNLELDDYYLRQSIDVSQSSDVTVDSDWLGAVTISDSTGVTVSRSVFAPGGVAIRVQGGGDVILASNVLVAPLEGIEAEDVGGLDVVGNTIQRGCDSAIVLDDEYPLSNAVFIENNLVEDGDPVTARSSGGYRSNCVAENEGWAPDITVGQSVEVGVTSDYNDFYSYGTDDTAPYSWGASTYPTLSAFTAATNQGAHDVNESIEAGLIDITREGYPVDAIPIKGSAAVGSANTSAPGELSSDFYGSTPYNSRGALQYANDGLVAAESMWGTTALGINASGTGSTGSEGVSSYTYDWGDGHTSTSTDTDYVSHTYAEPGTYTVTITVSDTYTATASISTSFSTRGSDYTPFGPVRLLDTRYGIGAPTKPLSANGTLRLQVAGYGGANGIPADVTAVVLNLTVTNAHGSGFITAYDDGDPNGVPTVSNVNYASGQTVPNLAIVPVGTDGEVAFLNGGTLAGNVDLIADITGYFSPTAAGGYTSLAPDRLVDTRYGTGAAEGQVGQHGTIAVQIAGADGGALPSSGITAVALNVTVTNTKGSGFLTVYPHGQALPNASNVNYTQGQTVANSVIVPVAPDGMIDITNSGTLAKGTDIIVDVVGYYDPAGTGAYVPTSPYRGVDTRGNDGYFQTAGPLAVGKYIPVPFGWITGANATDITCYVLNATVTNTAGNGVLTVAPDPNAWTQIQNGTGITPTPPDASNLNWTKGETVPNLVQASTGNSGVIDFWNQGAGGGTTDLIVDVYGYYQND